MTRLRSLESGRRIDPENGGLGFAGVHPAMQGIAGEVEAVAGAQLVILFCEPNI
jgi:hypothetical protein